MWERGLQQSSFVGIRTRAAVLANAVSVTCKGRTTRWAERQGCEEQCLLLRMQEVPVLLSLPPSNLGQPVWIILTGTTRSLRGYNRLIAKIVPLTAASRSADLIPYMVVRCFSGLLLCTPRLPLAFTLHPPCPLAAGQYSGFKVSYACRRKHTASVPDFHPMHKHWVRIEDTDYGFSNMYQHGGMYVAAPSRHSVFSRCRACFPHCVTPAHAQANSLNVTRVFLYNLDYGPAATTPTNSAALPQAPPSAQSVVQGPPAAPNQTAPSAAGSSQALAPAAAAAGAAGGNAGAASTPGGGGGMVAAQGPGAAGTAAGGPSPSAGAPQGGVLPAAGVGGVTGQQGAIIGPPPVNVAATPVPAPAPQPAPAAAAVAGQSAGAGQGQMTAGLIGGARPYTAPQTLALRMAPPLCSCPALSSAACAHTLPSSQLLRGCMRAGRRDVLVVRAGPVMSECACAQGWRLRGWWARR